MEPMTFLHKAVALQEKLSSFEKASAKECNRWTEFLLQHMVCNNFSASLSPSANPPKSAATPSCTPRQLCVHRGIPQAFNQTLG